MADLYKQINGLDNRLIKYMVRLATSGKFRNQENLAIIYGEHLIVEAQKYQLIEQIFVLSTKLDKYQQILVKFVNSQVIVVNDKVMAKINLLDTPCDIVAVIKQKPINARINFTQDLLVLEQIQDPGNLGTILRSASACGIAQVAISKQSVDLYNPKVLRASQGIQLALDIYVNLDLIECLTAYQGQILALSPCAVKSLYQTDLTVPTALVLGNEGQGLSEELLRKIKQQVKIPMNATSESLNLAIAASISLFEMARQRLEIKK